MLALNRVVESLEFLLILVKPVCSVWASDLSQARPQMNTALLVTNQPGAQLLGAVAYANAISEIHGKDL